MNDLRNQLMKEILEERIRQLDLPGSEWDIKNTPNDWIALISHYISENARRNGVIPSSTSFRDSIIKTAAICIAALEHMDLMIDRNQLDKDR